MSSPYRHKPYSVEKHHISESAIVYLTHDDKGPIAIKRLKAYKDNRYNLRTSADRQACQLEALHWNRIFTAGAAGPSRIYKGLALLCKKHTSKEDDISPQSVCIGPLIDPESQEMTFKKYRDYVLVMEGLPDVWRLDNLLANSSSDPENQQKIIMHLTDHLAYVFQKVLKPLNKEEHAQWGTVQQLRRKLSENLIFLRKALNEEHMSRAPYDLFRVHLRKFLRRKRFIENFQKRLEAGFIMRCHGDLKTTNIWIVPTDTYTGTKTENNIWLLDTIDFNSSYCYIDVLSDFALLVVDIQARTGSKEIADSMIKRYLSQTQQENMVAHAVLCYYLIEKALVCAATSIKFDKLYGLGEEYIHVAESRLRELLAQSDKPLTISSNRPNDRTRLSESTFEDSSDIYWG